MPSESPGDGENSAPEASCFLCFCAVLALVVKNLLANAGDTREESLIPGSGRSPGGKLGNLLQHSCWTVPWTEEPGGLQSMESQRVGHD